MHLTKIHAVMTVALAALAGLYSSRLHGTPLPELAGCETFPAIVLMLAVLSVGLAVQVLCLRARLLRQGRGAAREQFVRSSDIASELTLSDEVVRELEDLTDGIKRNLGTSPDMWSGENRMR